MKISPRFVAFLENINFTNLKIQIRLHKKFGRFVKSSYTPVYCNFAHVTHLAFGVRIFKSAAALCMHLPHGLRTPNKGINQRDLKIWAGVTNKICFCRT